MKISSLLERHRPLISFEFFPPKTDQGIASLMETIGALKELTPSFVSMTYGAGGSTRAKTVELVSTIKHQVGIEAVAHLTCVGHTKDEIRGVLDELARAGVDNVLALRGDPPKGQTVFVPAQNGFRYASELVSFIKANFSFCVGVAGYPEKHVEADSAEIDLRNFKTKTDAGADFAVTQLFFDNADYFSYAKKVRDLGITIPVVAGIMPISDAEQIKRFTVMCGARIPAALLARLEAAGSDKEKVVEIGIEHATAQCRDLLERGAPGIHFYTLNKSHATREIFRRLKVSHEIK